MNAGMRGKAIITWWPWVVAALLWGASGVTWFEPAPVAVIASADSAATVVTVCAFVALLFRHLLLRLHPALEPGQRVTTDTEYFSVLEAITRGLAPETTADTRPHLTAVRPVSRQASGL
jgi:hypothetical protein